MLYRVKQVINDFANTAFEAGADPKTIGKQYGLGDFTVPPMALRAANPLKNINGDYITGLTQDEAEQYGKILGEDLSPRSVVWKTDRFRAIYKQPNMPEKIFNVSNPIHAIQVKFLIANGFVAPNKDSIKENPKYRNTVFYFTSDQDEETKAVQFTMIKEEVSSILFQMRNQKEKMLLVGSKLGLPVRESYNEKTLYQMLVNYKDEAKTSQLLETVLTICKSSPTELQADYYVFQSLNKIIKYDAANQVYTYEGKVLGSSREEIVTELKKPENVEILDSIIKSYKKLKKG